MFLSSQRKRLPITAMLREHADQGRVVSFPPGPHSFSLHPNHLASPLPSSHLSPLREYAGRNELAGPHAGPGATRVIYEDHHDQYVLDDQGVAFLLPPTRSTIRRLMFS